MKIKCLSFSQLFHFIHNSKPNHGAIGRQELNYVFMQGYEKYSLLSYYYGARV